MSRSRTALPTSVALALLGATALGQGHLEPEAQAAHRRSTALLEAHPGLRYDPTTILVRFRAEQTEIDRATLRSLVGGGKLRGFATVDRLELVETAVGASTAIDLLEPFVEYAEPNWVQRPTETPNDQFFSLQWGIHNTGQTIQGVVGVADADIDGTEAWDVRTGAPGFAVAIIDTGVDWDHPDLAGNVWSNPGEIAGNGIDDDGNGYVDDVRGWDFYSGDNNPNDTEGHGSHTAGTVGAVGDNGIGVAGVSWSCELVPLRFLGPQGGFTSDAIAAIEYCTTTGIKVSNNSWGGGGFSTALYDAIDASRSIGHVFVAAAGNSGVNNDAFPHYPSSYALDNVISVAAIDNRDQLANESTWASNYGASSVDLGAPGVNIASTWASAGYVWNSGTSMATPHVTGVAVLLYAQNPGWSYSQVVSRILSTTRSTSAMSGVCTTGGVLDAFAALDGGGGPPDTTPPAAPTGLSATAGDGSVSLDWADNGESDLAGYRVRRSTSSGGGYVDVSGLVGTSAWVDGGVANGTTYYYVVTAEDGSGNVSAFSAQASATPQGPPGGTVEVLFADGFESGNFSAGGWTTSGNPLVTTAADQGGSWGARIRRTSWIERAASTAGYGSIELSYARRTAGLESNEFLFVEYWNGSSWVVVEQTRSTSWSAPTASLGGDAADNAAFRIRFRTNANRNNERGDVDDVELVGTTL